MKYLNFITLLIDNILKGGVKSSLHTCILSSQFRKLTQKLITDFSQIEKHNRMWSHRIIPFNKDFVKKKKANKYVKQIKLTCNDIVQKNSLYYSG